MLPTYLQRFGSISLMLEELEHFLSEIHDSHELCCEPVLSSHTNKAFDVTYACFYNNYLHVHDFNFATKRKLTLTLSKKIKI